MTTFQIVAIAILVASLAWNYLPALPAWPKRKPSVMKQLESVIRIREESNSTKVKEACNELLQALLQ